MTSLHLREGLFLVLNVLAISDPYSLLCNCYNTQFNSFALTFFKLNGTQFNFYLSTIPSAAKS